ncbi:MAG: beta-phosphoglucomutase, partial [Spirochaetia bacterium]|nr:beta-phosphoglucomutase [Spirochaetia bacterium]
DKVQLPKPQPDLFLYAAQLLDEYPSDCLGVEDALAGIEAIKKAGMKAVAVSLDTALADCCVKDSSHLTLKLFEEVMQL